MTKSILLPLLALCTLATCVRADDETPAGTDTPAAQLERTKRLMEKFRSSIVRVFYRFKLDDAGEEPPFRVFYTCPHCAKKHALDAEHYMAHDIPFEAVGFALAPDRVLLQDLRVPSKWVASIQVGFNGALYDAKEISRHPAEGGLLLATDRPLEGVRPLSFDGEGMPRKPAYFFAVNENGLTVSGIKGPQDASFKHYGEAGKDVYEGPANTILVDEKDRAVTVSLQEKVELGRETVAPPARWKSEGAGALDERHEAVRKRLSASVLPIYLRLESKAQDVRSYGDGGNGDEINAIGFALENGEVLVAANLSAENAARLNLVQHVAGDGSRTTLSFVGAFDEWGAFLARFPDGRLPAGVEPVAFTERTPADIFLSTVYAVGADNNDDKIHLSVVECRVDEFTTTWGGSVVPVAESGSSAEFDFCCDANGAPLSVQLKRRQGQRWSSGEVNRSSGDIARLLAARAFNPEYAPRVDTDRNRVAWIGVDVMRLTDEVAREKKVTSLLRRNDGSLVTRVYPGTPAAAAGIKEGDILISVRPANSQTTTDLEPANDYSGFDWSDLDDGDSEYLLSGRGSTPWPTAEGGINRTLTRFGIGAKVVVAWASNGTRRETEMTLERLPVHFNSARRSRNRDIGMTVCDMTYEVRNYFRLGNDEPGVVVTKLKSGDPAAVAGLRPFEIITEVNGRKVFSARDFAEATRDVDALTFSVRRLTATRVVRISK